MTCGWRVQIHVVGDGLPPSREQEEGTGGSRTVHKREGVVGFGGNPHLNLPPSRRPLRNFPVSPTTSPITLTLILSQDGRGDKRDGYDGYAKVSVEGEEVREREMMVMQRSPLRGKG